MAKKSTIKRYLPWVLVGGAAIAAYMYFKQQQPTDATAPTLPPLPPGTTPDQTTPAPAPAQVPVPVIPQPLQIGKAAKVKSNVQIANGYITKFKGSIFPAGGNKGGLGGLKTTPGIDLYAGTVQEIDPVQKSVRVLNFTYPMKDEAGNFIYSYWLNYNDIEGNY